MVYRRVDVRVAELELFSRYMEQLDITVTTDPSAHAVILIHEGHAYINPV